MQSLKRFVPASVATAEGERKRVKRTKEASNYGNYDRKAHRSSVAAGALVASFYADLVGVSTPPATATASAAVGWTAGRRDGWREQGPAIAQSVVRLATSRSAVSNSRTPGTRSTPACISRPTQHVHTGVASKAGEAGAMSAGLGHRRTTETTITASTPTAITPRYHGYGKPVQPRAQAGSEENGPISKHDIGLRTDKNTGPDIEGEGEGGRTCGVAGGSQCELCHNAIAPGGMAEHLCSTMHLFLEYFPPSTPNLITLPQNNIGYRLLRDKLGWQEDEGGLGAQRQGRMEPIPTTLRIDRSGIGSKKRVRAVTGGTTTAVCGEGAHGAHGAWGGASTSRRDPARERGPSGMSGRAAAQEALVVNMVGEGDGRARITHFHSHKEDEAASAGDGLSRAKRAQNAANLAMAPPKKAELRRRRKQDLAREVRSRGNANQQLRLELCSDIPDEFTSLFMAS